MKGEVLVLLSLFSYLSQTPASFLELAHRLFCERLQLTKPGIKLTLPRYCVITDHKRVYGVAGSTRVKSGVWSGSKEDVPSCGANSTSVLGGRGGTVLPLPWAHAGGGRCRTPDVGVQERHLRNLVLKADEPVGDSGEKHHIRNYPLQREISSVKLSCLHLTRALECKLSGAAYYMHIMPSKINLKHLNTTLMMDFFQEEYSVPNSLNVHQHCCRLVACSTANLQQNSYILMFHWILQICKQLRGFVAKHNT